MVETRHSGRLALPEPTLRRLPWYLAYVKMLDALHVEHVSSTQISKKLNVDASQIAKDLSFLNIKGKTRIGYEVRSLAKELTDFLGFKRRHNAFVIGTGSLGSALMGDVNLVQYGLNIVAGFDVKPGLVGTKVGEIPIYDIGELAARQHAMGVTIAVLAVPVEQAQEVTEIAVSSGIKAIWNFTPFRIKVPSGIVVENTSIYAHLAVMYNRIDAGLYNTQTH